MSAVISGSSSGPGGSSVAGVGTGSRTNSGSMSAGDYSNSRSDLMPSNVIYATNAHSENAPYFYGSNAKNGSMLDYINMYNQYNIDNANDRYDYRFQKMLDYNTANYNKGLEWSKMMSDTAIQRQVQDLIKAGLNPVLAARLGGANYSMPSIPYVNNVANPLYNTFDSQAYNSELDYSTNKEYNMIEMLKNSTNYLMHQEKLLNDKEIAELNSATSMYNNGKLNEQEWLRVVERIGTIALTAYLANKFKGDKGNGGDSILLPTEKAEIVYKQFQSLPVRTALSFADYVNSYSNVPEQLLQFLPTLSESLTKGLNFFNGAMVGSMSFVPVLG